MRTREEQVDKKASPREEKFDPTRESIKMIKLNGRETKKIPSTMS